MITYNSLLPAKLLAFDNAIVLDDAGVLRHNNEAGVVLIHPFGRLRVGTSPRAAEIFNLFASVPRYPIPVGSLRS